MLEQSVHLSVYFPVVHLPCCGIGRANDKCVCQGNASRPGGSFLTDHIYVLDSHASPYSREAIVLKNLIDALKHRAASQDAEFLQDSCDHGIGDSGLSGRYIGAFRFKSEAKVIAAGQNAFISLADYYKTAVFVDSVDLLPTQADISSAPAPDIIKRVFWSSLNTSTMVALGKASWKAMQLLPGGRRHYFPCPPIRLPLHRSTNRVSGDNKVMLIAHGGEDDLLQEARIVADRLKELLDSNVETYGFAVDGIETIDADSLGRSEATIHVHVGNHDEQSGGVRIIDSWVSGRTVVQYIPSAPRVASKSGYQIDDGVNGLRTYSIGQTANMVAAMVKDPFLQSTLKRTGQSMTSSSREDWERVVDVLVK